MKKAIFRFYKQTSDSFFDLSQAQKILLDILNSFKDFCRDNNISFSLTYGSLIGAMREKGIIKWDDDIDLMMDQENFNKVMFLSDKLKDYGLDFYHYSNIRNIYTNEIRIYKKGYYRVLENNGASFLTPLCIDIFPFYRIGTDRNNSPSKKDNKILNRISKYKHLLILKEAKYNSKNKIKSILRNFKRSLYAPITSNHLHRKIDVLLNRLSSKDCENYCLFSPFANETYKVFYSHSLLTSFIKTSFNDIEVPVIKHFDYFLSKVYGDWKKPRDDSNGKVYDIKFVRRDLE